MEHGLYILLSYGITITVLLLTTVVIVWRFLYHQKQMKNIRKQKRPTTPSLENRPHET
ncbi:MAG TPA: heme exporter protein CcmD [Alphaproteobacteria bacterium]|nr:heme exporter protein CcmD [Alphaproteobacteria bacterium]